MYDFDSHVTCKGVVVRVVEPQSVESEKFPTGFGVRIMQCDDTGRAALKKMIDRAKTGDVY